VGSRSPQTSSSVDAIVILLKTHHLIEKTQGESRENSTRESESERERRKRERRKRESGRGERERVGVEK
jgi:hypothetical protein